MWLPGRCAQTVWLRARSTLLAWLVAMTALAAGCSSSKPAAPTASLGTVAGTVTSSIGGTITGATVTVTPTNGSALPRVTTNSLGAYSVASVPVGAGTGTVAVTAVPSTCNPAAGPYTGLTSGGTVAANVTVTCKPSGTAVTSCGYDHRTR